MIIYTPEDLLLYLYNECTPQEQEAIENALQKDWTLREKLSILQASMSRLDKTTDSPRTEVVLNVLNYAKEKQAQQV